MERLHFSGKTDNVTTNAPIMPVPSGLEDERFPAQPAARELPEEDDLYADYRIAPTFTVPARPAVGRIDQPHAAYDNQKFALALNKQNTGLLKVPAGQVLRSSTSKGITIPGLQG